jgi:predicted nucleotidyltransferase
MNRDFVIQTLQKQEAALRQEFGVKSLLLFGSVARDEANSTSDVDLGTPNSLKPCMRERVIGEAEKLI